jgi:hypothetical protein
MLSEKIDVTAFLVWFVQHWPESFSIMKQNPDYQNRFSQKSKAHRGLALGWLSEFRPGDLRQ